MRYLLLSFAFFVLAFSGAYASTCVRIENDLDRLACYDREAKREERSVSTSDAWAVQTETSKLTDQTNVYLSTQSTKPIACSRHNEPRPVTLWVRCLENTTALILTTHCHLTDNRDYGKVDFRIDGKKAYAVRMGESTTNDSLGLWQGSRSIGQIKKMFGGSRLLMRFTAYGQAPATAEFDINGLKEAIAPLRKACSW